MSDIFSYRPTTQAPAPPKEVQSGVFSYMPPPLTSDTTADIPSSSGGATGDYSGGATASYASMARMGGAETFGYQPAIPDETFGEVALRRATDFPKTIANAFVAATIQPVQEFGHQVAAVGHFLDKTWTGQKLADLGEQIQNSAKEDIQLRNEAIQSRIFDPTDKLLSTVGASFGTGIPAVASGLAAGPAAATTMLGYITGQTSRNEALDKGMTEYQAYKHGGFQGIVEAGTEYLPMKSLFSNPGPAKKLFKTLLQESYSEQIATVLQSFEEKVTMNPDQSWGSWWKQLQGEMALTAAAVPLTVGLQSGTVSLVEKASQVSQAYDALLTKEQARQVTSGIKAEQATATREEIKKLLNDAAIEGDKEAGESILVHHGSPSGELSSFDDTQVGTRNLGPDQPAGANGGRPAGHFSSESKGFASMFTRGPGSMEDIKDVPDLPASTVDVSPPQELLNVRDFLARNAPAQSPLLEEPPAQQQPGAMAARIKAKLAPIYEKWGAWQLGNLEVHVLDSHHQIPAEVTEAAKKQGFDFKDTMALYDGAHSVYILADKHTTPEEAIPHLYHESFGHFGMEQVVPNWDTLVPQIRSAAPSIMKEAHDYVEANYSNDSERTKAKETLAVWTQNNPNATNTYLEQVLAGLRNWTRGMGFNLEVTRNDVVNLLRKSREGVERGTLKGPKRGALQANRSLWDPSVRRWGEAVIGTTNFEIAEDATLITQDQVEDGQPFVVRGYHGSTQGDREGFSPDMLGMSTLAEDARRAHFFSAGTQNANAYAGDVYLHDTVLGSLTILDRKEVIQKLANEGRYVIRVDPSSGLNEHSIYDKQTGELIKGYTAIYGDPVSHLRNLVMEDLGKLPMKEQVQKINQLLGREAQYTAPAVFPVYIAAKNPTIYDMKGSDYDEEDYTHAIGVAAQAGHDVVVFTNVKDPHLDNIFAVLKGKENQIRSVNAKFDPSNIKSPELLAARGKVNMVKINPTQYLDLELPLVGQTDKVQEALRKAGIVPSSLTGQEFYDALVKREGGKKEASAWLAKNGIPGAKYREAFRPKGQKEQLVRNYITFSSSDASVLNAQAQNILAAEKARQQASMHDLIKERMQTPPIITYKKRIELLGKAIKMPVDVIEAMKEEGVVWNKFLEYAAGIEEIASINPANSSIQIYAENVRQLWSMKASIGTAANEQVRRWRKHIKAGQQSEDFDTLMREAGLRSEALGRRLTPEEIKEILKDHNLLSLKDNEIKFAHDIWEDYRVAFTRLGRAVIQDINATMSKEGDREAKIKEVTAAIAKAVESNFFPKSNFGERSVEFTARRDLVYEGREYKQGETVHYSTYSSHDTQLAAMDALKKEFPPSDFRPEAHKKTSPRAMEFMGIPPSFYSTMLARAEEFFENPNDVIELEFQLEKLKQENSPVSRLMKKVLRESRAFGYDENSQRVYSNFMQRFANQLSKITYGPNMQAAISSLGAVVGDNTKRDGIRDYLKQHRRYIMNPGNELSWLRSLGFNFHIAMVVKSALVNTTQVPLVLYPMLTKQYGALGATKALALNMDAYIAHFTQKGYRFSKEKTEMFDELIRRGDLSQSFANELAAVAEGATFEDMTGLHTNAVRNFDRTWRTVSSGMAFMFHHAEGMNRYITAGATYDLAIKKGASQGEAINEAMFMIKKSQGEYGRYNRPKMMQGKASVAFLFMRYVALMLFNMKYDPAKWRILSAWLLAGGLMGLPFSESLMDLLDATGSFWRKKMGYKDPLVQSRLDLMRFIENMRSDTGEFGEYMPNADSMMHGLSRKLPIPFVNEPTDISSSLSLGRPIPGTQEVLSGRLGEGVLKALGAVAEIGIGAYDAITSDNPDAWKNAESALPMGIRHLSAATRWMVRGNETNASGQVIKEFDPETDIGTMVARGMGFTPTSLNQQREIDYMKKNAVQYYESWKGAILGRAYAAYMRGNEEDQRIVQEERLDFNDRVPYPEMGISPEMMNESITGKERLNVLQSLGFPAKTKPYARLYTDMAEVHERATK